MARTRKRVPSPEPMEEEDDDSQSEVGGTHVAQARGQALRFDKAITWRAGKPLAVSELLRRLRELFEELTGIEQDDVDRDSLIPKAQELANAQLIGHRDKGVKAWTLLNIVEMFRILAPDAPYKQSQLKQIFAIFVNETVPALADPNDPYNDQHLGILSSLTDLRSIILLTDIPGSDLLLLNLFTNCFDMLSGNTRGADGASLPKNVEYFVTNMLCTLVDECAQLPEAVVDVILAQFLRADPIAMSGSNKDEGGRDWPDSNPAYNAARSICNTCSDKVSRYIENYFSSVLIDASDSFSAGKGLPKRGRKRGHDDSDDDGDEEMQPPPAEQDLQEVEKAHRLLRELWRSSPDAIKNIMPQIETELSAENAHLRTLAVQTVGDMIAGVGAAGFPRAQMLDPEAYPSQSIEPGANPINTTNPFQKPNAPHSFSSVHPSTYQAFTDRRRDKVSQVRAAWSTEAGRVIATAGGGKGLDAEQEQSLLKQLADTLVDTDEKVRLAAVGAVAGFSFDTIQTKVGSNGSISTPNSVLSNLADRIKDHKRPVRLAATELLARIWGVAAGAIAEGNARTDELLGLIPSRIMSAWYVNNPEIHALISKVTFESLLPVRYPPIKKTEKSSISVPSNAKNSQDDFCQSAELELDPDAIRTGRILTLVKSLEAKSKTVFFALVGKRQTVVAQYLEAYLRRCEEWQGGHSDKNQKETERKLEGLIDVLSKMTLDPLSASEHLKKYAKVNDRRSHQLIRFCYDPASEYRKVANALSNFRRNVAALPGNVDVCLETLLPLVRSASILVYNKSHVPAVVWFSRNEDKGFNQAAHEVLKEISTQAPAIFKAHVLELCQALTRTPPSGSHQNDDADVDTLKACADFARKFPNDMPTKDRKFYQALSAFALHGRPPSAAKHAVTIIVESAEKKEMYISQLLKACIGDFKYGEDDFLAKLASLSQLRLLANTESDECSDDVTDVAVRRVLSNPDAEADESSPVVSWDDEIDNHLAAKLWALKVLVNGLRGNPGRTGDDKAAVAALQSTAVQVYRLLNTLIERDGEFTKTTSIPPSHKSRLRLSAAVSLLKLCSSGRVLNDMLGLHDFNRLAKIAQDPLVEVRRGFSKALKKYLGQGKLPSRFYALVFVYAYEPNRDIKENTVTWIRSRAALARQNKDSVMEGTFARFMSLLAHHQDFSTDADDILEFVEYIVFYLRNTATETNLPIIYHVAQRLKTVADGIDPDRSERLYILSDLADAVIRQFCESQSWSLQLFPGKLAMPRGIFQALPSHEISQEISEKRYLPDEVVVQLEDKVKSSLRAKKRKAESKQERPNKKVAPSNGNNEKAPKRAVAKHAKGKASKPAKTPRNQLNDDSLPSSERRRSGRNSSAKNYAENESSDDDLEMQRWDEEAEKENMDIAEEGLPSSTPPTTADNIDDTTREESINVKTKATAPRQRPQRAASKQMSTRNNGNRRVAKKVADEFDLPGGSASE